MPLRRSRFKRVSEERRCQTPDIASPNNVTTHVIYTSLYYTGVTRNRPELLDSRFETSTRTDPTNCVTRRRPRQPEFRPNTQAGNMRSLVGLIVVAAAATLYLYSLSLYLPPVPRRAPQPVAPVAPVVDTEHVGAEEPEQPEQLEQLVEETRR